MIITAPYAYFRALFAACADKGHPRLPIRNLHVDTEHSLTGKVQLVATDRAQVTWADAIVIDRQGVEACHNYVPVRLPPRTDAMTLLVQLHTIENTLSYTSRGKDKTIELERHDNSGASAFPVWRRFAFGGSQPAPLDTIGLDFAVLAPVAEALGSPSTLTFGQDQHAAIKVDWIAAGCDDIHSVLMPVRI